MRTRLRTCYLLSAILGAPLAILFEWVPFLLCKELGASPLQLAVTFAAKPCAAILSFYWTSWVHHRGGSLRAQIVGASLLGAVPALFFGWMVSSWFLVVGFVIFAVCTRALIPSWMEVFRKHLDPKGRSKLFARGSLISYVIGFVLPIGVGWWMDSNPTIYRTLFVIAAGLVLVAAVVQLWLPRVQSPRELGSLRQAVIQPWTEAWGLLRRRRDFALYQGIFMLGGLGLMVMHPALPAFFTQKLQISWTEIALAISAAKALGFVLMNRFWARWIHRTNVVRLSANVTLLAALFPLIVLGAKWQIALVGLAYVTYGGMKAGSDLAWHLSGPIFAKGESSLSYSSVNIVLVGLRGLVGPFVGALLLARYGPTVALLAGSGVCFAGFLYGQALARQHALIPKTG